MDKTVINNLEILLEKLNQLGIKISLRDDQLVLNAPKGVMTAEIREQISHSKESIIKYLKINNDERPVLQSITRTEKMPLSFAQQRMWFLYQLNPDIPAYNISAAFQLKGNLNIPVMQKSINAIIKRHETLRTSFHFDNNTIYQKISDNFELPLDIIKANDFEQAKNIAVEQSQLPFRLDQIPLLRLSLIEFKRNTETEYLMVLVIHHIIADAWSCGIFAYELAILYKANLEGVKPSLPELKIQYTDYSIWQKQLLEGKISENQINYWKDKLKDAPTFLPLPLDKKRPAQQRFKGSVISIDISNELKNNLKKTAQSMYTTLFVFMISAFQILLHRYTGEEEILTGFPIAGRHHKGIESLIGFFVNTLVLRGSISDKLTFKEFVRQIHENILDSFINQDLPFEKLVESLHLKRNINYTPLFQVMFVMQNIAGEIPAFPGLDFNLIELDNHTSKFDLTLSIKNDCSTFSIEYNTDIFNENTIKNFLDNYLTLLKSICTNPDEHISKLNLLGEEQYQDVLSMWRHNIPLNPPSKGGINTFSDDIYSTIHSFIEDRARNSPDKVAIKFENEKLTYQQLNERANQLANRILEYFSDKGNETEKLVGLSIDVSLDMIIALVAILKSGCAYVPLDPALPTERLEFIIDDCQPELLITNSDLKEKLPVGKIETLYLDLEKNNIEKQAKNNPGVNVNADNLAYVIYTSGSTGKPNGVPITHKNVLRLFETTDLCFDFNQDDKWVLFHSFAFDYSVWEIWNCFYHGSELLLVSKQLTRDPENFYKKICEEKITVLNQTPSAFANLSREAIKSNQKHNLRWLILSGDALDTELLRDWFEKFGDNSPKIANPYGITETTVFVTFKLITKSDLDGLSRSPIGVGLADLDLYILDREKQPVPFGVSGELYVGGAGLSRGYLNRPELTKTRFIDNPFAEGKLYKTGDHVRALPNGELEFLGRLDHQIKIRGFRIELGEIETYLNQHPSIKEAVVLLDNDNIKGKYLIAYFVLADNQKFDQQELQAYLKTKLPEVMIPSVFISLEKFPLNNNGKVDKKNLPKPDNKRPELKTSYIPPRNEAEKEISKVFQELLGIEKVGLYDNFFDIGAHSLLMVEAHRTIQDRISKSFSLIDMFNYPTISSLSEFLAKTVNKSELADKAKIRAGLRKKTGDNEIAIIGMAGRFPGADNVEQFWDNISNGVESVHFFSDDELRKAGVSESLLKNPKYIKANALLDDIDLFDSDFFGYTPREAEVIDPQQRLFLECSYHALENAGYNPENVDFPISVFAGSSLSRYLMFNLSRNQEIIDSVGHFQLLLANDKDYLATRTAYKLNLKGPAITLQTACSTSLVAVHTACQSILNGDCDMAIAGGISLDTLKTGYLYQEGSIASPDGHCRAFDEKAGGIVGGSGVGIVVLKRLKDAIKDNDNIYAVIKGSAINNDGSQKIGFMAPGIDGQAEVISNALAIADINPENVDYIETHGTATPIGDPIEIEALSKAYKSYTDKTNYCAIGSVKTNIGHLDMAAGVSGLIKTVQALRYKKIPPSLHFVKPNPKINFSNSPFFVNTELREWNVEDKKRIAAVSSFGVGGTNAHVILEESPENIIRENNNKPKLVILSAKTQNALDQMTENLSNHLNNSENINLANMAYTLQVGRKSFNHRRMFVCDNLESAKDSLNNYHEKTSDFDTSEFRSAKVVFMFSGLGTQYAEMGKELYENESVFREEFDICNTTLSKISGINLKEILFTENSENTDELHRPSVMQPAIFIIQYALAKLWLSKGVAPHALMGHSFGEYTAFCIAGIISLEEALTLVAFRGKLFEKVHGSMLAVSGTYEHIQPFLNEKIYLANFNAKDFYTFAGSEEDITQLQTLLKKNRIASNKLDVPHATHCSLVEPIVRDFSEALNKITFKTAQYPIISNITGEWLDSETINQQYFIDHMLKPVHFYEGLKNFNEKNTIFLEIGAGNSLNHLIRRNKDILPDAVTITSLPIKQNKSHTYHDFLISLGKLWLHGCKVNWTNNNNLGRIPLPGYPFERKRYWIEASTDNLNSAKNERSENINEWFYIPSWKRNIPLTPFKGGVGSSSLKDTLNKVSLIFEDQNNQLELSIGEKHFEIFSKYSENIIRVIKSTKFEKISDNCFSLNPDNKTDYESLFKELNSTNLLPDKVIYCWTLENSTNQDDLINNSFNYLIYVVQAIGNNLSNKEKVDLKIISDNVYKVSGHEEIIPEKSLLNGINKVVSQEYENIICQNIDIDKLTHKTHIIQEIFSTIDYQVIAYRNNFRWLQTIEKEIFSNHENTHLLKTSGTYIITGGMGGIGLTIAEFISETYNANIILINRTEFPPEKDWDNIINNDSESSNAKLITKFLKIKENSSLIIEKADVTSYSETDNIFSKALVKFGEIDGVIHAAGIPSTGLIQSKNIENSKMVLDVKIKGADNITRLAQELKIELVILFSSLSTQLGGVAQSDYVAANTYLNSLADSYSENPEMKVITIDWCDWKKVGMAEKMYANNPELKVIFAGLDNSSITPEEGIEVFKKAISHMYPQIFVSPVSPDYLKEKYKKFSLASGKDLLKEMIKINSNRNLYARPKLNTEYIEPVTDLEKIIANIWQNSLGIEKIGLYDNFFELGGHSLLLAGIKMQLEDSLDKELPMAFLFNSATIKEMSEYIENQDKNNASLVTLKATGNKTPFFCVHAISGTAFPFSYISSKFDSDRPFYAFQAQGFSENSHPLDTINKMAEFYINELQGIQNESPYLIGGWSFGGIVALEIAQQLIDAKKEVSALVIIDMKAPDGAIHEEINEEMMTERFIHDMKGIFGNQVSLEDKNIQNIYNVFKANVKASLHYHGKKYPGKIIVFRAVNSDDITDDKLGWDKISDDVTVFNIVGDHYSILKSDDLIEKLNHIL